MNDADVIKTIDETIARMQAQRAILVAERDALEKSAKALLDALDNF